MDFKLTTPVLFITYKRPDTTALVFKAIRDAQPTKLYLAANAPNPQKESDPELCRQVREIISRIDWPCEVKTLFRKKHLSAKDSISGSINWLFENEETGIILEDDCLPQPTFFRFCQELLAKYANDSRIMMISGDNFQQDKEAMSYSYYFSRYNQIWGWATWRRAWNLYDVTMKLWPELKKQKVLHNIFEESKTAYDWEYTFDKIYRGEIDTWDYQHTLCCFINNSLCINPKVNLISNIGYGQAATNTFNISDPLANVPAFPINFPLLHPPYIIRSKTLDARDEKEIFHPPWPPKGPKTVKTAVLVFALKVVTWFENYLKRMARSR